MTRETMATSSEETEATRRQFLRWRHIESREPCHSCQGSGTVFYGSTATWRSGMGGAAMTPDVCDKCWGSGDVHAPWTDLRRLRDEEDARVKERAAHLLAEACGVGLRTMKTSYAALADILDREGRRRKRPEGVEPFAWDAILRTLSKTLRAFMERADG